MLPEYEYDFLTDFSKSYFHYKTILCCKAALDVKLMNFFI